MTCKDCIHSGLCYKENDYENFPDRCGSFISERPQGEWIFRTDTEWHFECNQCKGLSPWKAQFCGVCGADMRKGGAK